MVQVDRRAGKDRRAAARYRIMLDIEWEGPWGRKSGTLGDISDKGCFVLCSGEVEDGSVIKILLPLSSGSKTEFLAEVANHVLEVGFAARFIGLTAAQQEFLRNFVDVHREH